MASQLLSFIVNRMEYLKCIADAVTCDSTQFDELCKKTVAIVMAQVDRIGNLPVGVPDKILAVVTESPMTPIAESIC